MDPRIALNPSLGAAILAALRTPAGDAQVQTLLALVGERVDLLLLSTEGDTVKLQLPSGQVIEAEGDLPYPPGTRLAVQVLPPGNGQSAPRLKLVEAVPPPPLPILSPLQQGEAQQLLARLTAAEPPPELVTLARLFTALGAEEAARGTLREPQNGPPQVPRRAAAAEARVVVTSPDQARSGSASPSVVPAEPPPAGRIVAMLRELPPAVLRDLQRTLFPGAAKAPSLEDTAEALRGLLRRPETVAEPAAETAPSRPPAAPEIAPRPASPGQPTGAPAPLTTAEPATEALKDFLLLLLRSSRPDSTALTPGPAPEMVPATPPPSPQDAIEAILRELPPAVLRDLQRALFPAARTPPSLAEVAEALRVLGEAIAGGQSVPELETPGAGDVSVLAKSANALFTPTAEPTLMPLETEPLPTIPRDAPATRTDAGSASAVLPDEPGVTLGTAVPPNPAEAAVKLLRSLQETLFSPTPALPSGAADPALEPLKNLLLSLQEPASQPDRRATADSLAAAVSIVPKSGLMAGLPAKAAVTSTLNAPPTLPTTGRIVALMRELSPGVLLEFQRIVFAGSPATHSLPELAEALRGLLQSLDSPPARFQPSTEAGSPSLAAAKPIPGKESPVPAAPGSMVAKALPGTAAGIPEADLAKVLLGVQEALSVPVQPLPSFAFQGGDPAMEPLKNLLLFLLRPSYSEGSTGLALADLLARAVQTSAGGADAPAPEPGSVLDSNRKHAAIPGRPAEAAPGPELSPRTSAARIAADRLPDFRRESTAAAHQASAEPPAAAAKSWESWLSAGVRTLSDPLVSPREAPFHLAQAKEGTAFFELPLPWDGQGKVVQLWVESDAGGKSRENGDPTRRVLVGLHFSALGETRVGIVVSGDRLQVRVWTEHPELLKDREAAIRSDLTDLGPELDLQVLALGEPGEAIPSLRALADGSGFHALG